MKVITLDTGAYEAFVFPYCDRPIGIHYDPQDDRLLFDPDAVLLETPIRAIVVAEVYQAIMTRESVIEEAWRDLCAANDDSEDWLNAEELIASWDLLGTVAIRITTHGMVCGPVSETVFYILNESDWQRATLLQAVA